MIRRLSALAALAVAATVALSACSGGGAQPAATTHGASATGGASYGLVTPGTLTIATEGTYPPFDYHADNGTGALTGYDVDVITAVAKKLDLKPVFKQTQFDGIFAGLDAGRFDLIADQISINPDRQKKYLFSTPYTYTPGVVIVLKGNDSIHSFTDLKGKTTAQSLTSNWYQLAKQSGANVQSVQGWAEAVSLLRQHRVDATINDKLTYLTYLKTNPDSGLKVAATTADVGKQAFAFQKDKQSLVKAVDDALSQLAADGTLTKISEKYFGADVSK